MTQEIKKQKDLKDTQLYKTIKDISDNGTFTWESLEKLLRMMMSGGLNIYESSASIRDRVIELFSMNIRGKIIPIYMPQVWVCENKIKDEIYYYGLNSGDLKSGEAPRDYIDKFLKNKVRVNPLVWEKSVVQYAAKHREKYGMMLDGLSAKPNYQVDITPILNKVGAA